MSEKKLEGFDQFGDFCGIKLKEQTDGRAVAEAAVEPHHLNGLGSVHGGFIFTLADIAFAAASNCNGSAVGVSVNISYLKGGPARHLRAEANRVANGRKISHYNIDITNQDGLPVAKLSAVAYNL